MNKHIKVVVHEDVKQTIIDFFATKTTEELATEYHDKAEEIGFKGGTDAFDQAIEIVCKELKLDSSDLVAEIKKLNKP